MDGCDVLKWYGGRIGFEWSVYQWQYPSISGVLDKADLPSCGSESSDGIDSLLTLHTGISLISGLWRQFICIVHPIVCGITDRTDLFIILAESDDRIYPF